MWRSAASRVLELAQRTGHPVSRPELRAAFDSRQRRDLHDTVAMAAIVAGVLRRESSAVDVGAHRGSVLSDIVRHAPMGHHIAFEPIPRLATELARDFPGVDVRQCALSDGSGTAEFSYVTGAPGYSGLRLRQDLPPSSGTIERITVRVDRLDDALPADFHPVLIKIDVEGAELGVLRGARETLTRHEPIVIFEHGVGGADVYGSSSAELWDLFDECNYAVVSVTGQGPYSRSSFSELFTAPQWNYMAVPVA
jgi:FkbM family methyltransferase